MKPNNFGVWKPYYILTPEAVLSGEQPIEVLLNEALIVSKDYQHITGQRQTPFSKDLQPVLIECPEGYMRALLNSPLLPVAFIKPTNKGIFPSNTPQDEE